MKDSEVGTYQAKPPAHNNELFDFSNMKIS
jgi:hypothetical protein